MSKYLVPLGVFVGGQVLLLVGFLFFSHINAAGTQLAADTVAIASTFWGWTWVVSSIRLIIFVLAELLVLYMTARAFMALKH